MKSFFILGCLKEVTFILGSLKEVTFILGSLKEVTFILVCSKEVRFILESLKKSQFHFRMCGKKNRRVQSSISALFGHLYRGKEGKKAGDTQGAISCVPHTLEYLLGCLHS